MLGASARKLTGPLKRALVPEASVLPEAPTGLPTNMAILQPKGVGVAEALGVGAKTSGRAEGEALGEVAAVALGVVEGVALPAPTQEMVRMALLSWSETNTTPLVGCMARKPGPFWGPPGEAAPPVNVEKVATPAPPSWPP